MQFCNFIVNTICPNKPQLFLLRILFYGKHPSTPLETAAQYYYIQVFLKIALISFSIVYQLENHI